MVVCVCVLQITYLYLHTYLCILFIVILSICRRRRTHTHTCIVFADLKTISMAVFLLKYKIGIYFFTTVFKWNRLRFWNSFFFYVLWKEMALCSKNVLFCLFVSNQLVLKHKQLWKYYWKINNNMNIGKHWTLIYSIMWLEIGS